MAPAYDLTFSTGLEGEHSTMMMGEGKNPGLAQFKALAESAMLNDSRAQQIIGRIHKLSLVSGLVMPRMLG